MSKEGIRLFADNIAVRSSYDWLTGPLDVKSFTSISERFIGDTGDNSFAFISGSSLSLYPGYYGQEPLDHIGAKYPESDYGTKIRFNAIKWAIEKKLPVVVVGDSSLIACKMAGGEVIQYIPNRGTKADPKTWGTEINMRTVDSIVDINPNSKAKVRRKVCSRSSEVMYPFNIPKEYYNVISWDGESTSDPKSDKYVSAQHFCYQGLKLVPPTEKEFFGDKGDLSDNVYVIPHIVHFKNINTLAITYNPQDVCMRSSQFSIKLRNENFLFKNSSNYLNNIVKHFLNNKL